MMLHHITGLLRRVWAYQRIYNNWFDVILQVRKGSNRIFVEFKNGSAGFCSLDCVRRPVDLVFLDPHYFNPKKFYFQNDAVYYESNKIITDSFPSALISIVDKNFVILI